MSGVNPGLHIVCPHCDAVNRVPAERLGEGGKCGVCRKPLFTGEPAALTADRLQRHIDRSDIPVVVDFWAPWCGPCRAMAPVVDRAAKALEPRVRLAKLNTDAAPELSQRLKVASIPTLIAFRGGQERGRMSGALPLERVLAWIQTLP